MLQFTSQLKKEIDTKIEQIECSEISMINKSLKASRILAEAYKQLKTFILSYTFQSEEEEILFFKETLIPQRNSLINQQSVNIK